MAGMLGKSEGNQMIQNYYKMALDARENNNYSQCETYCDRILSLDYEVPGAWMLKASSIGWQSNLGSPRDKEMFNYYQKALSQVGDIESGQRIMKLADADSYAIGLALMQLACERFVKWPDADEVHRIQQMQIHLLGMDTEITGLHVKFIKYSAAGGGKHCYTDAASIPYKAAETVMGKTKTEFLNSNGGYPDDYDYRKMLDKMGFAETVFDVAATMDHDMTDAYKKIIENHKFCINAYSCSKEYSNGSWYWTKHLSLLPSAVSYRNSEINKCLKKIDEAEKRKKEKEEKEKKERIEAYWKAHAEEKEKLLSDKTELSAKKNQLEENLKAVDQDPDIVEREDQIKELNASLAKLGFFAMKEKKRTEKIIAERQFELEKAKKEMKDPINAELRDVEDKIRKINVELTKDRK